MTRLFPFRILCALLVTAVQAQQTPVPAPTPKTEEKPEERKLVPPDPVVKKRAERLRRGVNLSHWFAQVFPPATYSPEHFATTITNDDLRLIKSLGFDHVRMPIAPEPFIQPDRPGVLPREYLAQIDQAIDRILEADLAVMVDIHPDPEFRKRLAADDQAVSAFARFWQAFAAHLKSKPADRVFLEILNEPEIHDAARWRGIQKKLAAAARSGAPLHTLVIGGDKWSSINELQKLEPLADRNVIYNFHMYEPGVFTHQGATWGWEPWRHIQGLVYPSDPAALEKTLASVEDPQVRAAIQTYFDQDWNESVIRRKIGNAAEWARRHGVVVHCNEFGVYKKYAPEDSRTRWLADVTGALEQEGIGWTMWDYAGGFHLVRKGPVAVADEKIVEAIGVRRPFPASTPESR